MASFVCYRFQCPRYPDCALAAGKGCCIERDPDQQRSRRGRAPRRRSIPISALLRRILSMPGCAGSEKSVCISRADLPHTEEKRRPLGEAAIRERKVPGRRGNTR